MSVSDNTVALSPLLPTAEITPKGTRFPISGDWFAEVRTEDDARKITILPGSEGSLLSVDKQQTAGYYRLLYKLDTANLPTGEDLAWLFTAVTSNRSLLNWVALLEELPTGHLEFLARGQHNSASAVSGSSMVNGRVPLALVAGTSNPVYLAFQFSSEGGNFTVTANRLTSAGEEGEAATAQGTSPAAAEQAPLPRLSGHLERTDKFIVRGWAFNHDDPGNAVQVEILVDGESVGFCDADEARPDLQAAGYGNGKHGFSFPLPDWVRKKWIGSAEEHVVAALALGGAFELRGSPSSVSYLVESALFVERSTAALVGWARWKGMPDTPLRIALQIDGKIIGSRVAEDPVRGFGGPRVPEARCGFAIPVPKEYLDNAWHTAEILEATTGNSLGLDPIRFRLTRPRVAIGLFSINGRIITGEALDPARPKVPLQLHVRINGRDFGVVNANRLRAGVAVPKDKARHSHSFSLPLPPAEAGSDIKVEFSLEGGEAFEPAAIWRLVWNDGHLYPRRDALGEISAELLADSTIAAEINDRFNAAVDSGEIEFSEAWYRLTYPEVTEDLAAGLAESALQHYATIGIKRGYSPSDHFDETWYRAAYPQIATAVESGVLACGYAHFLFTQADRPAMQRDRSDRITAINKALDNLPPGATKFAPPPNRIKQKPISKAAIDKHSTSVLQPFASGVSSLYGENVDRLIAACAASPEISRAISDSDRAVIREVLLNPPTPQPLVSVIMPTFNRAYTIAEAVQSVLDQTYTSWELLICDDGSFDKTSLVVAQFNDPRIRYLQFEKTNGAATRNKGLRFAKGEFIAYLDSDNLWHPLFLETMIGRLRDRPWLPLAFSGYIDTETVGTKLKLEGLKSPEFDPVKLTQRNFVDLNTLVHRAEIARWLGTFDEQLPRLQDWDLVLRYASIFFPMAVPYYLAFYRRNVAWGQVTHLFAHEDTQGLVREKTRARLEEAHVALNIPWARMPSLAILIDGRRITRLMAKGIAALLGDTAAVRIYIPRQQLTGVDIAAEFEGVDVRPFGPLRSMTAAEYATQVAALITEETVLTVMMDQTAISAIGAARPDAVIHSIAQGSEGLGIASNVSPDVRYQLGSLPLLPLIAASAESPAKGKVNAVVLQTSRSRIRPTAIAEGLKSGNFNDLKVALTGRNPLDDAWALVTATGTTSIQAIPDFENVDCIICLTPLEELTAAEFALVTDLMGQEKLVLVVPSGLGSVWTGAGTAFPMQRTEWTWIFDKIIKLERDEKASRRLRENARTVYNTVYHAELAKERLKYFLAMS